MPSFLFHNRQGDNISAQKWKEHQLNPNYVILEVKAAGNVVVILEWTGITVHDMSTPPSFRCYTYDVRKKQVVNAQYFIDEMSAWDCFNQCVKDNSTSIECPLCNGHMIKRTGQYGTFYGCSNWHKTKCQAKLDENRRPTPATVKAYTKQQKPKQSKPLKKRIRQIDLD